MQFKPARLPAADVYLGGERREGHAHGTEGRDGEFSDVEWKR